MKKMKETRVDTTNRSFAERQAYVMERLKEMGVEFREGKRTPQTDPGDYSAVLGRIEVLRIK